MEEGQTGDRLIDALQDWQQREKRLMKVFGERVLEQREFIKEKLRLYKEAYYGHERSASKEEKLTLAILGGEIAKLEKKVYPNLIQRGLVQLNDFVINLLRPSAEIPELTIHTFNPQKIETLGSKPKTEYSQQQTRKNSMKESRDQTNKAEEPEAIYHQKTKAGNARELSAEAAKAVRSALSTDEHWLAYSHDRYSLGAGDLYFFKNKGEADEFAISNISDRESFRVVHFESLEDVYHKILNVEKLRTDPDANPLYDHDGNPFTDQLIEHIEERQFSNNLKNTIMNEKNLEFLQEQMKNMGFGDKLNKELENVIRAGSPDFTLKTDASFNNQKMEAMLYFRKGEQNEMYFFNKYDAVLKNENPEKEKAQTFYVNQNRGVTFKEAFNLLEGRAVNKDLVNSKGEKYNAWIQINFGAKDKHDNHELKQYHQNYGFELDKVLGKHPIKELENADDRKMLIGSLRRGNQQSVDYEKDGQRERMFIEANPKERSINVYDKDRNLVVAESVKQDKKKEQSNDQGETKEVKLENKKEKAGGKDQASEEQQENKKAKTKSRSKDELEPEGTERKVSRGR